METLTYTDENGKEESFRNQTNIIFTTTSLVDKPGFLVKYVGKEKWSIIYKDPIGQPLRLDLDMNDLRNGRIVIKKDERNIGGRSRRRRNKRRTRRLR